MTSRTRGLVLLPLLAAALPAAAQTTGEARRFVTGLYEAYAHSEPDYVGRQAGAVFSPRLLGLMRRDARRAGPGEVGALDGDPICDCQDPAGLEPTWVGVDSSGPGRASVRVELKFPDGREVITLDLVSVHGRWRVDDVHSPSTPSLVKLLQGPAGR